MDPQGVESGRERRGPKGLSEFVQGVFPSTGFGSKMGGMNLPLRCFS